MHNAAFKQSSLGELMALSDLEFFSFSLDPALHALLEIHWPYRIFWIEMRNGDIFREGIIRIRHDLLFVVLSWHL